MKLEDITEINMLVTQYNAISAAIIHIKGRTTDISTKDNYSVYISQYSDGSGRIADLSGCYVLPEVITATIDILKAKRLEVLNKLAAFGVDVGKEYGYEG